MVFVTGGTGFLGSYLLKYLIDAGKTVRALRRPNSDLFFLKDYAAKIEWVEGDTTDVYCLDEAMKSVEQVYHAAAIISFDPKKKQEMMRINVEGTANVVNMALENGVKKLCHVSSIASLGRTAANEPINEVNQWEANKLNSEYSLSKFRSEWEVWRGVEEGLDAVIVNPSIIIGAGSWDRFSAKLFNIVWKGLPYYPLGTTGYVDVRDVARVMIRLMDSEIKNERFVLNSENVSFKDLFYYIADAINKKRPAIKVNSLLANLAWRGEALRSMITGKEPLITKETATISAHEFYYDSSKIKKAINYEFIPVKETVREAGVEFLKHKQVL